MIKYLIYGLLAALPITGILCVLRLIFYVPFRRKAWIARAQAQGRSAKAELIKCPVEYRKRSYSDYINGNRKYSGGRSRWTWFVYAFTYHDRQYKVRVRLEGHSFYNPPKVLTVYWRTRPGRAQITERFGGTEGGWVWLWIVLAVILAIIFKLIGSVADEAFYEKVGELVRNGVW